MLTAIMDNPFAVGDLVHIAQGTTLYKVYNNDKKLIYDKPMPVKILDKPTTGYIINKYIDDYYLVGVGNKEYLIRTEEIRFLNEVKNVY